jgi:hypothetical protein
LVNWNKIRYVHWKMFYFYVCREFIKIWTSHRYKGVKFVWTLIAQTPK